MDIRLLGVHPDTAGHCTKGTLSREGCWVFKSTLFQWTKEGLRFATWAQDRYMKIMYRASFYPYALREISVLTELALGHLRYCVTDVPPPAKLPT